MSMLSPALELRHINKSYDGVIALNNASISIAPGSIHGVIGENGAGKSSLMQVAYGLLQPDGGQIFIDGVAVSLKGPSQAIEQGIGMLHQQANWLEQLTVFENVMLAEPSIGLFNRKRAQARVKLELLCREFGFEFSLSTKLSELDYSQRQLVDVLRSLYRGVRVLILDEPLALLSPTQAGYLNKLFITLKLQGISVVVVSHKLAVLHQLCDVISVIREGVVTACVSPKLVPLSELSILMIGRELMLPPSRVEPKIVAKDVLLNIQSLYVKGVSKGRKSTAYVDLTDINLSVFSGEIIALIGQPKAGQEVLLDVMAGLVKFKSGTIEFKQRVINSNSGFSVKQARELGIGYAPSPLINDGMVDMLSMAESVYLGYQQQGFGRWGIISNEAKEAHCRVMMENWRVLPILPAMQSSLFSGGNQQKMVLARELAQQPALLLLNQATQGVDASASDYLVRQLFSLRDRGASVIFYSSDLDEVMSLADRVCIFNQGRMVEVIMAANTNKADLALLIAKEPNDA